MRDSFARGECSRSSSRTPDRFEKRAVVDSTRMSAHERGQSRLIGDRSFGLASDSHRSLPQHIKTQRACDFYCTQATVNFGCPGESMSDQRVPCLPFKACMRCARKRSESDRIFHTPYRFRMLPFEGGAWHPFRNNRERSYVHSVRSFRTVTPPVCTEE